MISRAATGSGRVIRRTLAAALAVGLAVLGTVTLPTVAGAVEPGDWAPVDSATIRPGAQTDTDGGRCTGNFIFINSDDDVFIGQAAHCSSQLAATDTQTDGCSAPVLPIGTPVKIAGASQPGELAYNSWNAMQAAGESDPVVCNYNDFALIRIHPDDLGMVNPTLPVFGGPSGLDVDGVGAGERVFGYGNSPDRFDVGALKPMSGVSVGDIGDGRAHNAYLVPPVIPGDSGGPHFDANGSAIGSLIGVQFLPPPPGATLIADLSHTLAYANEHGDVGAVELVTGTEPFSPRLLPGAGV